MTTSTASLHAPDTATRRAVRRAADPLVPPSVWDLVEPHLLDVRKPAQYVGGEVNMVAKAWADVQTRWLLCYPDAYEVGQPNQGIQILYELLNERPTSMAHRAYAPWLDMDAVMREHGLPVFSLEGHVPLWAFDVFAVTLPHELAHTNLLNLMDLGGIPHRSADRTADHPLVVVGGHAAFNPEPLADFVDVALAGDGEEFTLELDAVLAAWKRDRDAGAVNGDARQQRTELLDRLARNVEGAYVPEFYEAKRTRDGGLKATVPTRKGLPDKVVKRTVQDLEQWQYPKKQLVPMTEVVHERFSVEIFRGCTRGCRFCQAGMITRPVRERRPETIQNMVVEGVKNTGFEEVGLLSLSSADHAHIGDIARDLADHYDGTTTSLSLPSTRVDAFNITLSNELARNGRRTGLTFAPEAGSERMRAVINKMVSEEDMLRTAELSFANGWRHVKLYFMVGLPTETDEDVEAIGHLGVKVYEIAKRHGQRNKVTVSVGGFVPKPHTPFQWVRQDTPEEIRRKLGLIRQVVKDHRGVTVRTNDPDEGVIEGLLARGGRELCDVVEAAWRRGALFDGWHETTTLPTWLQALEDCGIDLAEHNQRARGEREVLPWDHLDSGLEKSWLWDDWQEAIAERELDDCRWIPCYDCGVCPGLELQHDTGFDDGRKPLPIVASPRPLGGDATLPVVLARQADAR